MSHFTPSRTLPPITPGADPATYHKLGSEWPRGNEKKTMSNSELVAFGKGPSKWIHGIPKKSSGAMEWGSLIDCLMLTPRRYHDAYAVAPTTYTAKGKKKGDPEEEKPWNWNAAACQEWREQQDGRECISAKLKQASDNACYRLNSDEVICAFLLDCKTQVQVCVDYSDTETGLVIPIKCLLDIVPIQTGTYGDCLGDLKTTTAENMNEWNKLLFYQNWYIQAALYMDAFNAVTGEKRDKFMHVISESEPPYEPRRTMLSEEFLQLGRTAYMTRIQYYCQCLKRNFWPGYSESFMRDSAVIDGWQIAEPTIWMMSEE